MYNIMIEEIDLPDKFFTMGAIGKLTKISCHKLMTTYLMNLFALKGTLPGPVMTIS